MVDAMAAQRAHHAAMNTTATITAFIPRGVAAVTKDLMNAAHTSANVASAILPFPANTTESTPSFNINGVSYMLTPTPQLQTTLPATSNLCIAVGAPMQLTTAQLTDLNNFEGYLAASSPLTSSLDWTEHFKVVDLSELEAHALSHNNPNLHECPFILDSGATCHISPECSDFKMFHPINLHPITGLGGACMYAVGIGTVELFVDSGHVVKLHNVLYVPTATVHLVSIVTLNCNGRHYTIFGPDDVWLTDFDGTILAHGIVSSTRNLFILTTPNPRIASNTSFQGVKVRKS